MILHWLSVDRKLPCDLFFLQIDFYKTQDDDLLAAWVASRTEKQITQETIYQQFTDHSWSVSTLLMQQFSFRCYSLVQLTRYDSEWDT